MVHRSPHTNPAPTRTRLLLAIGVLANLSLATGCTHIQTSRQTTEHRAFVAAPAPLIELPAMQTALRR